MINSKIIILNNNKVIYYKPQNITLISILEKNDIILDSQCKQGYCGSCRIKLLKGHVYYKNIFPLASCKPKDIFPCCCTISGSILIKI
ncbi:putative iron-sulphur binding protein [Buchnera aphidicola str. Bp (Baizongia pistaciae)]|uniref:Uncharacterized ferredoxin-like protein bbp_166 n=1 Tax=Buchnera aphidicola subsp. Baizongia pistaciae (strain Bp) TaxID=224915 RepID=Y166_BUCBP|nr:class I ribonucleotide reductase maintenance protein YfaE [Buchnera aphidicola]Q89AS6.1 RecName: Full=Uncharacterized ferredoxin-like protein bbp_166 [Buchnera aphidicola str. Bp (Baizongia pistaciae)]AAO26899.1 putative iron-sulphur binding protein [Buchnera aphidicola str. Bp (Baizongia pistaciae)]